MPSFKLGFSVLRKLGLDLNALESRGFPLYLRYRSRSVSRTLIDIYNYSNLLEIFGLGTAARARD